MKMGSPAALWSRYEWPTGGCFDADHQPKGIIRELAAQVAVEFAYLSSRIKSKT
jgi:hypothetical protein